MTSTWSTAPDALDCRPGDVVIADLDRSGWRVIVIEDVVALRRLVPLGERGSRTFVDEHVLRDSQPPAWHGEVHLLVSLHPDRFDSPASAHAAADAAALREPVAGVCVPAVALTAGRAELHRPE